jgi:hypothetical protein
MTPDELLEEVARVLGEETYIGNKQTLNDAARAIIAVVLEEAAKVAERTTTYEDLADKSHEEWFATGRAIAAVIRAMKGETE